MNNILTGETLSSSTVYDCCILALPTIHNRAGNISIVEGKETLPFAIKRVYYLYDVPSGSERGGHAHKKLFQLIVAAGGSFEVVLDDGKLKRTIFLNRPNAGLLIPPGMWREIINFSAGSTLLVLASMLYSEEDYIRNYNDYLELKLK